MRTQGGHRLQAQDISFQDRQVTRVPPEPQPGPSCGSLGRPTGPARSAVALPGPSLHAGAPGAGLFRTLSGPSSKAGVDKGAWGSGQSRTGRGGGDGDDQAAAAPSQGGPPSHTAPCRWLAQVSCQPPGAPLATSPHCPERGVTHRDGRVRLLQRAQELSRAQTREARQAPISLAQLELSEAPAQTPPTAVSASNALRVFKPRPRLSCCASRPAEQRKRPPSPA